MQSSSKRGQLLLYAAVVAAMCIAALPRVTAAAPAEQGRSRTFPETKQTVTGRFLDVWEGGRSYADSLYINGFPVTDKHDELSLEDGKVYPMQWFERARYEQHAENKAPYDVLLGRLGAYAAEGRSDAPFKAVANPGAGVQWFPETQHSVGDSSDGGKAIASFWGKYGGIAQFGYPLSQPFQEVTRSTDPAFAGKSFLVQYFERQRLEYHPENKGTQFEVLLGLLGVEQMGQAGVIPYTNKAESGTPVDTLRFGISQEPDTLYSLTAQQSTSFFVLGAIERPLIGRDENGQLFPQAAAYVPTIDNGGAYYIGQGADRRLVVKLKLRHGLKWSDGVDVTSNDVVFGFKLALDPDTQIADRSLFQKVHEVVNPDPYTIIYNFLTAKEAADLYKRDPDTYGPLQTFAEKSEPVVDPIYFFVGETIYPEHIMGKWSALEMDAKWGRNPIGFGPYKLSKWEPGQYIELVANENYTLNANKPRIHTIRFNIVTDPNALIAQLQSGNLDMAAYDALTLDQAPVLDKLPNKRVDYVPAISWEHLNLNTERPGLSDVRVRQAIAYGINRQSIVDNLLFGKTKVSNSWMPPAFSWSLENPLFAKSAVGSKYKLEQYAYNPDKANQLLDAAGWTQKDSDGIRIKDGHRLSLEWYTTVLQVRQNTALAFKQDLAKVGVELKPNFVQKASDLFGNKGVASTGDYDVAEFASTYPTDPGGFGSYHSSQVPTEANNFSGQNYPRWKNDRSDTLITTATNSIVEAERAPAYAELQQLVNQEAPRIGMYARPNIHVAPANIKNFRPTGSTTAMTWNAEDWFVAK